MEQQRAATTTGAGTHAAAAGTEGRGSRHAVVDTVKEKASAQLDAQKGRATDALQATAHAVRETGQQLRGDNHETIAQYMDSAAGQLEQWAWRLREARVDDVMRGARSLARQRPALFVAGSFAAGLLAARFLKSSRREHEWDDGVERGGEYRRGEPRTGTAYTTPRTDAYGMPGNEPFASTEPYDRGAR